MTLEFQKFVEWIFYGLLGLFFLKLDKTMFGLEQAIIELKILFTKQVESISYIKEDLTDIETRLKEHDNRLNLLERTK